MPETVIGPDLREQLERWLAEGLIDAGQAVRIEVAEGARARQLSRPAAGQAGADSPRAFSFSRRTPLVVEALGYLGGTLVIVAGLITAPMLWPRIPAVAELTIAAVATAAFGIAGGVLRVGDSPSFLRLRSVLWLMSAIGFSAFMAVLTTQAWDLGDDSAALVTALAVTAYAVPLWWRTRATLQHLVMFAGAAGVTGTAIASAGLPGWAPGLGIWGLGTLWALAVYRGYLVPRTAGYAVAGIAMLTGAQITMGAAAGPALALVTVAGLLAAGVLLHRIVLLGLGSAGVVVLVPQIMTRYLPTSIGAPLAVCAVGLILVGVACGSLRRRAGRATWISLQKL